MLGNTPKQACWFDMVRGTLVNGITVGIFSVARRDGGRSVKLTRPRTRALPPVLPALAAASVAVLLILVAFPTVAHAEPEPVPRSLDDGAPTITSPVDGSFLDSASAVITGTKAAGSEVQILAGTSRTHVCTIRSAATEYSCTVSRLPSGPNVPLTAVQLVDGGDNLESDPVRVDVLAPPTFAGSSPLLTGGLVQGGGYPNARVTLSIGGGSSWTFPAGPDGTWAYVLPRDLGSGTYTLTASQSTPFSHGQQSASSAGRTISLDVDAPDAPTVTFPASGSTISPTGVVYSGTGENGATVNVFALTASGADVAVCSAIVSGGVWRCAGASLPAGTLTVTAFQTDAAGNPGAGSAPLTVTIAKPAATAPVPAPSPSPSDDPSVAPVVPPAPPSATPTPAPVAPTEPAAPGAEPPDSGSWDATTPFTTAVPSALGAADLSWLRALVLAAVAILLLLVPARMLATTVGGRRALRSPLNLTGRNRVPTHDDPAPVLTGPGEQVMSALVVGVAAAIVLFANPVHGEPEYLRVLLASVVALAAINLVATSVPALLATGLPSGPARVALSPRLLLSVAAVALISRVLDLQPALLFGIVFTVTAVSGTRSARGIVAGVRIGAVFTAGILAWLASTLLGSPSGFFGSLLAEAANIAAMAGVGSAAVLLIPLGKMDGRALLVWSRPAWFLSAIVVLTVLFALLAPVVDVWESSGEIIVGFLIVLGFGAFGLSLWIWRRLIQPALTTD
jgi:hypothetical protein